MASRAATGRAIAIILAVVLAAGGAFFVWRYAQQADERAMAGAELVDVFVASGGIPQGMTANTAVQQELIEPDQVPRQNLPPNAVGSLEDISGLAALSPIYPGTILVLPQFGDPTLAVTELDIPEDHVAMSLQVTIPPGVAGHVRTGDQIGIIGHMTVEPQTTTVIGPDGEVIVEAVEPGAGEGPVTTSKFVASNIEVLSVGQLVVSQNEQGEETATQQEGGAVLLTLAVRPPVAEQLTYLTLEGQMYFTLLPDDFELPETGGVTIDNVFELIP